MDLEEINRILSFVVFQADFLSERRIRQDFLKSRGDVGVLRLEVEIMFPSNQARHSPVVDILSCLDFHDIASEGSEHKNKLQFLKIQLPKVKN